MEKKYRTLVLKIKAFLQEKGARQENIALTGQFPQYLKVYKFKKIRKLRFLVGEFFFFLVRL